INGYPDGTFKSTNKINRAEFMKIVVEAFTDSATGSNCFPDVGTEWFAKYICYAEEIGVVSGYPDGTFQPAQEINFAEASKIVNNIYELNPDIDLSATTWYEPYVEALADAEAIPVSIGDFDKSIARGEMAEVVWRVSEEITDKDSLSYDELNGDPVAVNSCEEFKELFLDHPEPIYYIMEDDVAEDSDSGDGEMAAAPESSADFSETNVQVSGVDEADIVKNDGEFIYTIKDDSVRVVKAYPASEMAEVASLDYSDTDFTPSYLFLNTEEEILTVLGTDLNYILYDYGFDAMIAPYYHEQRSSVYTYNVSDPTNPELMRTLSFDGSYSESRMIGETLYLVLNKYDY
ncbi:MAG: beta-propeller domain-containing protein, partial [Patescibacteria group bacterium]